MKFPIPLLAALLLPLLSLSAQQPSGEMLKNWNQWRGPLENGVAPESQPVVEWSESQNIKWKTAIPGIGHATPIIWENQIILLSAVPTDKAGPTKEASDAGEGNGEDTSWMNATTTDRVHQFTVISVDRPTGEILWKTVVREAVPYSGTHEFGSWASNSPITDGERIYAYFGSMGLYCLDLSGKVLWERDFGRMEKRMDFGDGSSPTLYKDKVIVVRDHEGPSSIHVLNKFSGETIWEKERDEISAWSTPRVVEYNGSAQLITAASNKARSYNPENGDLIWECSGLTGNVIPCPLYEDGRVYLMSGFRGTASMAIDLSKARGDITNSDAIVWRYNVNTSYTPSPVLLDGRLYFLRSNNGFLTCLNAADGSINYEAVNLEGVSTIFTSPLGAGGNLYVVGTKGTSCVVKLGPTYELLSTNTLDDSFYASPVALGKELYLKGDHFLYCIAEGGE
ncbi:MAG: PQQ-binding-like beta-propeller repeat protein [Bacteroidales bacterium]